MKTAYKLFRLRRDGTLGSLFMNARAVVPEGRWLDAEDHRREGFAHRPGWHCCARPVAPHLSERGRVWRKVYILDYEVHNRPAVQGGKWYVAQVLRVDKDWRKPK